MRLPTSMTPVPTIDAIALNPGAVKGLPREVIESLLGRCTVELSKITTAEAALIAELMNGGTTRKDGDASREQTVPCERWITPAAGAEILCVKPRWIYDHKKTLPFVQPGLAKEDYAFGTWDSPLDGGKTQAVARFDKSVLLRYCRSMPKLRAESREGMVLMSIALPRELHKRLAYEALERNAAMAELIRRAIEEYLGRQGSRRGR